MNSARQSVNQILQNFRCWNEQGQKELCVIEALGNNGGYSGALLWRITLPDSRSLCLRRWPRNPSQQKQVQWIHQVLNHTVSNGISPHLLPLPMPSTEGQSSVVLDGYTYELTSWLPGAADFGDHPSKLRIQSIATLLAEFHQRSQLTGRQRCAGEDLRGLHQRVKSINELHQGLLGEIESRLSNSPFADPGHSLVMFFRELEPTISHQIRRLSGQTFWQQVCIRDIWHDHVLFQSEEVSGLIDFGAMGIDNIGTDIARLFGSLFQNSIDQWSHGLSSYQSICELSDLELELIDVYDRSSTVLAGMNWLKWILVENRKFDSILPITKRMELLIQRMRDWI